VVSPRRRVEGETRLKAHSARAKVEDACVALGVQL
jgi:hypothetical protein